MTTPKKRGRPPFLWHSNVGEAFVDAVRIVMRDRQIGPAAAIRSVLKKPEFTYLDDRYDRRYLQKKFQEISDLNPYARLGKQYRRANKVNYRNKLN
jgi:hypothetical protein